jgi:4-hydroxy-tetrahydrodipicolinate synthase
MNKLHGTGVALVTPFTSTGTIDWAAWERLLDFNLAGGVEYLVINGTTGESPTTTAAEKAELLDVARRHIAGRVPLVYGIGGNDTATVAQQLRSFDPGGIDAILSASPAYNKPSQAGIIAHYQHLAEASPLPLILYNVPGRTGSNMAADTTLKLAEHENIIGIKEASGNVEQCLAILAKKPADFLFLSGDDMLTLPLIACGGQGIISVLANAFPQKFSDMTRAALAGDFTRASQLLYYFTGLNPLMYEEGNPVGVKAALALQSVCEPAVRLPLVPASEGLMARIKALL